MAEGDGTIFNGFKRYLMEGVFNLDASGDTLQLTLHTSYTPNIDTHVLFADAGVSSTEYGTADGYTAGGKVIASQLVTQDDGNDRGVFDAADVTWTSLGALSPATPSHTILWDNTPATPLDPLIAYWDLGSTATNGGDFTIQWSTSPSAIILLT